MIQSAIVQFYDDKHELLKDASWRPLRCYNFFVGKIRWSLGKPIDKKRILDAGFGAGQFLSLASRLGAETFGIDISAKALWLANKFAPGSALRVASMENIPFESEYFDAVTALGSLEHVPNIPKALQEFRRVGKADCKYLIVVPNSLFLFAGTDQKEIELLLPFEKWVDLLSANGFKILSVCKDKSIADKYNGIKGILAKCLIALLPLRLTYQFVFVCEKVNG